MARQSNGMTGNRVRTASRRQMETRADIATTPFALTREQRFGINRASSAAQGYGAFPRTAGQAMGYAGAAATKRNARKTGPNKKGK